MKSCRKFPFRWHLLSEQSFSLFVPLISISLAFLLSASIILAWGVDPLLAYDALIKGAFGSPSALATTLTRMTPLIFTGLAVAYGYRGGFFNIGVEGQLILGAYMATWVALSFPWLPGWILIPACILAAAMGGGFLAGICGFLKAWKGTHEALTTLLLNYITVQFFEWAIRIDHTPILQGAISNQGSFNLFGIKDPTQSYPNTAEIVQSAQLPSLLDLLQLQGVKSVFGQSSWYEVLIGTPAFGRITLAPLLGILAIAIVYVLLFRTAGGFKARAMGFNPDASHFFGIGLKRTMLTTSIISGILGGMAGAMEVMGSQHRLIPNFLVNAGFEGIPVALIGQLHPVGIFFSALFFGAMHAGANRMQIMTFVPVAVIYVIQALAILFSIACTSETVQRKIKYLLVNFTHAIQTGMARLEDGRRHV